MRTLVLIFLISVSLLLVPAVASPQEVCPCVPLTYQWIVTPCDTWNCAAAATIMANGDRYVLSVPTGSDDFKWVIVRRVVTGSAVVSPNAPFKIDSFESMIEASTRFDSITRELQPMLITSPDRKLLVIARSEPERHRAVGH
jgi:hypothetical protein